MSISIKIQHDNDASLFFDHLKKYVPEVASFCKEAEANAPLSMTAQPEDDIVRKQQLAQTVADRVFEEAKAWMDPSWRPNQIMNYNTLSQQLPEIQSITFVYRNLVKTFEGTAEVAEFQTGKYTSTGEMYGFFEQKDMITTLEKGVSQSHHEILKSVQLQNPASASYQNCGLVGLFSDNVTPSVKKLDLSHNLLQGCSIVQTQVQSLDLSYNQISNISQSGLPESLKELRLRGNPIKELRPFEQLSRLELLDISYMPDLQINDDFWEKVKPGLKVVISPDMTVVVPMNCRDKITFVSALDEKTPLEINKEGTVICPPEQNQQSQTTSSSSSIAGNRGVQSVGGRSYSRNKFWDKTFRWLRISALLGVFSYVVYKLWTRAKA